MSVHKYFLTLKIKTATVLLKGGMSVSEVSDTLGFSSQGYFSATYKRETGNNPSQI
jgi:AraC-like DNA-binding protein